MMNEIETNDQDRGDDSQMEFFPCSNCLDRFSTDELFTIALNKLSKKVGRWITPNKLIELAVCWNCTDRRIDEREFVPLTYSLPRCRKDNDSRRGNNGNGRQDRERDQRQDNRPAQQPQAIVTAAEAAHSITCCICLLQDKETSVRIGNARGLGWLGAQVLDGVRRFPEGGLTRDKLRYIGSVDLLQSGHNGFGVCTSECVESALPLLREKAEAMGFTDDEIADSIGDWSLASMIVGVRKAEQKRRGRNS